MAWDSEGNWIPDSDYETSYSDLAPQDDYYYDTTSTPDAPGMYDAVTANPNEDYSGQYGGSYAGDYTGGNYGLEDANDNYWNADLSPSALSSVLSGIKGVVGGGSGISGGLNSISSLLGSLLSNPLVAAGISGWDANKLNKINKENKAQFDADLGALRARNTQYDAPVKLENPRAAIAPVQRNGSSEWFSNNRVPAFAQGGLASSRYAVSIPRSMPARSAQSRQVVRQAPVIQSSMPVRQATPTGVPVQAQRPMPTQASSSGLTYGEGSISLPRTSPPAGVPVQQVRPTGVPTQSVPPPVSATPMGVPAQSASPVIQSPLQGMQGLQSPFQGITSTGVQSQPRVASGAVIPGTTRRAAPQVAPPQSSGRRLKEGGGLRAAGENYVRGGSSGQSDKVPAMLSDGEYVFDADSVAALGDGNNEAGAAKLDKMRENIRAHKRSAPTHKIPPKAKTTQAYMKGAK